MVAMPKTVDAELSCKLVSVHELWQMWDQVGPMLQASYDSCEVTKGTDAKDILTFVEQGHAFVFVMFINGAPALSMAIQFAHTPGRKIAFILGMGGSHMRLLLHHYWPFILDWLRDNGVSSLYTECNDRNARVYLSKYGFTKSATKLAMDL